MALVLDGLRVVTEPLETVADKRSRLTPEVQRKVLGDNAVRLYRL